jgi:hypothetical protein
MNEIERRTLIGVAGVGALAALSKAGPLNPPAGPVAATGRTVDEIYNKIPAGGGGDGRVAVPGGGNFIISQPGSYVLTGDIVVSSADNGLLINTDNVTVDLNGYAVRATTFVTSGIVTSPGVRGVVVRNGRVNGFQNGVLINSGCQNVVLEDILVRSARSTGIFINGGTAVRIRRCTVQDTGLTTTAADSFTDLTGILLNSAACTVEECTVNRLYYAGAGTPTRRGIWVQGAPGNVISRCAVVHEAALTAVGIAIAGTNVYRDNTVVHFSTAYSGGINGGGNV